MRTINLFGPINSLGFGVHFTNWANELLHKKSDFRFTISPWCGSMDSIIVERMGDKFGKALDGSKKINFTDPGICLWEPHMMQYFCGYPRIGYTVFETDQLTEEEKCHLKQLDYIFVTSEWAKETLSLKQNIGGRYAKSKIIVIPEGVDPNLFNMVALKNPIEEFEQKFVMGPKGFLKVTEESDFIFLSIGKLEYRKGQHLIVQALLEALENEEKVTLIGSWHNPFVADSFEFANKVLAGLGFYHKGDGVFEHSQKKLSIVLVKMVKQHEDLKVLHQIAHVAIFAYYGEGWCLPLIECLASGIPTIAPYNTGPTEYLNDEIALLVKDHKSMPANDGVFFNGEQGNWQEPNLDELIEKVLWAYQDFFDYYPALGEKASEHVTKKFNWRKAADKTVAALGRMDLGGE